MTQGHVQGDLGVVEMAGEFTVLVWLVVHGEGFVRVEAVATPAWIEDGGDGVEVLRPQGVQQALVEAEFVQQHL